MNELKIFNIESLIENWGVGNKFMESVINSEMGSFRKNGIGIMMLNYNGDIVKFMPIVVQWDDKNGFVFSNRRRLFSSILHVPVEVSKNVIGLAKVRWGDRYSVYANVNNPLSFDIPYFTCDIDKKIKVRKRFDHNLEIDYMLSIGCFTRRTRPSLFNLVPESIKISKFIDFTNHGEREAKDFFSSREIDFEFDNDSFFK